MGNKADILGVLGNQVKELRCEKEESRIQGERELSFAHRNNLMKAQLEN